MQLIKYDNKYSIITDSKQKMLVFKDGRTSVKSLKGWLHTDVQWGHWQQLAPSTVRMLIDRGDNIILADKSSFKGVIGHIIKLLKKKGLKCNQEL